MNEILYKNYLSFLIDNKEVSIVSDETDYGLSSVIDFGESYYYLGDQFPDLDAVLLAWKDFYGKNLSEEEILKIKEHNKC